MATKTKKRHKRRQTAPNVGKTGAAGSLRMVVAANPGSEISVAPELDLVKSALLYGDKVTVISPVTTMFLRVEGMQRFSALQQIELMRRVAPILMEPEDVPSFQEGLEGIDDFLRRSEGWIDGRPPPSCRSPAATRSRPTIAL